MWQCVAAPGSGGDQCLHPSIPGYVPRIKKMHFFKIASDEPTACSVITSNVSSSHLQADCLLFCRGGLLDTAQTSSQSPPGHPDWPMSPRIQDSKQRYVDVKVLISLRIRGPPPWLPRQQGLEVRNLRGQETVPRPRCWWPAMACLPCTYARHYQQDSLTLYYSVVARLVAQQPEPAPVARPPLRLASLGTVVSLGLISSSTRPLLSHHEPSPSPSPLLLYARISNHPHNLLPVFSSNYFFPVLIFVELCPRSHSQSQPLFSSHSSVRTLFCSFTVPVHAKEK